MNNDQIISKKEENQPDFFHKDILEIKNDEIQSMINETLEPEEKKHLLEKILSNIHLEDKKSIEYGSFLFSYLLNREGTYDDSEIEFITYFTIYLNYQRLKYDEERKIKPRYENMQFPSIEIHPYVPTSPTALAAYALSTIFISNELSIKPVQEGDKDSLFSYLQALSHEMVHFKQDYEAEQGLLTESSFKSILEKAIRLQTYDDNRHNYRFRETEVEAQIESMQYAVELAREYFPTYIEFQEKMLFKRENYLLEEALSFQYDDESFLALRDFYDIGLLSIAVAKGIEINHIKIDLLKKYPQLLAFFNNNREIRKEEELLQGYKAMKDDHNPIANIYEQFLVYIYHKEPILQNTSLSSDLLKVKINFITSQIKKEQKYLSQIEEMIYYQEYTINRISKRWGLKVEEVIQQRKERIHAYKLFLDSVPELREREEIDNIIENELISYDKILYKIDKENMLDLEKVDFDNNIIRKG